MTTTYAVLLPGDEDTWEAADEATRAATYAAHGRFARVLRRRGEEVVRTEGPYAESAEQLTGFHLVATRATDAADDTDGEA